MFTSRHSPPVKILVSQAASCLSSPSSFNCPTYDVFFGEWFECTLHSTNGWKSFQISRCSIPQATSNNIFPVLFCWSPSTTNYPPSSFLCLYWRLSARAVLYASTLHRFWWSAKINEIRCLNNSWMGDFWEVLASIWMKLVMVSARPTYLSTFCIILYLC